MISNERIIDAYLCVLDLHNKPGEKRQLRELRATDFDQIRKIKKTFDGMWVVEKNVYGPRRPYYIFRQCTLDRWQQEYRWKQGTRNLYASIMSKLTNWNRNHGQLSDTDRRRLDRVRPGAMPILAHLLPEQTATLL